VLLTKNQIEDFHIYCPGIHFIHISGTIFSTVCKCSIYHYKQSKQHLHNLIVFYLKVSLEKRP